MNTESIQEFILKDEHNLRVAAAVGEAWVEVRRNIVDDFLGRLDTRLKKKLKGWEWEQSGGMFFEGMYAGYYFWKPTWPGHYLGLECHDYGEQMLFGVGRNNDLRKKPPSCDELLNAIKKYHPAVRANAWWEARIPMHSPAADWRSPRVLWQMHKDDAFLVSVAEQLLEVARAAEPFLDRLSRKK